MRARLLMAAALLLCVVPVGAELIHGSAIYRERLRLPPEAVLEVTVEDVSRADAPAPVIGRTRVEPAGAPPIPFAVEVDPADVEAHRRYSLRGRISVGGAPWFVTDQVYPVLDGGPDGAVTLLLRRVSSRPPVAGDSGGLRGAPWHLITQDGFPVDPQRSVRIPQLHFLEAGRLAGTGGCNRFIGTYRVDGDHLREGLCADLGFGEADRRENIRRASEVAKLMVGAGLTVVATFISPFRQDRDAARSRLPAGRFVEVFIDTPLEVAEARDPKGLYRRARAGQIAHFTGISSPYEPPERPEIRVDTTALSPERAAEHIVVGLRALGLLPQAR